MYCGPEVISALIDIFLFSYQAFLMLENRTDTIKIPVHDVYNSNLITKCTSYYFLCHLSIVTFKMFLFIFT